jgi:hypothetical protein
MQKNVPERLRSFLAGYFWARAEKLMHNGPVGDIRQGFQAGSYAGNTDIMPALQMVILLMPEEPAPYQLAAANLSRYLDQPVQGLRLLQHFIIMNPQHPAIHELYASAAFLKIFAMGSPDDQTRISALKYLDRAIAAIGDSAAEYSSDPAFDKKNYAILKARLLLEMNEPQQALKAWEASGEALEKSEDRIAHLLRDYRDRGIIPQRGDFPEMGSPEPLPVQETRVMARETEKAAVLPVGPMIRLLAGAGLLLILLVLLDQKLIRD